MARLVMRGKPPGKTRLGGALSRQLAQQIERRSALGPSDRVGGVQTLRAGELVNDAKAGIAAIDLAQQVGILAGPAPQVAGKGRAILRQHVMRVLLQGKGIHRALLPPRGVAGGRVVAKGAVVEKCGHRVEPESVHTARAPEPHNLAQPRAQFGTVMVETGLAGQELVQAILPPPMVPAPGRRAEEPDPVAGRAAIGARIRPDIEIAVGLFSGKRFAEPAVGDRGVIEDLVDHHQQAQRMRPRHQRVEIRKRAEARIDRAVILDIIAAVAHRRQEEGRQPDRVHAQRSHVVQFAGDPAQVSLPGPVAVAKGPGIDLVDDGVAGPGPAPGLLSSQRSRRHWGAASGR